MSCILWGFLFVTVTINFSAYHHCTACYSTGLLFKTKRIYKPFCNGIFGVFCLLLGLSHFLRWPQVVVQNEMLSPDITKCLPQCANLWRVCTGICFGFTPLVQKRCTVCTSPIKSDGLKIFVSSTMSSIYSLITEQLKTLIIKKKKRLKPNTKTQTMIGSAFESSSLIIVKIILFLKNTSKRCYSNSVLFIRSFSICCGLTNIEKQPLTLFLSCLLSRLCISLPTSITETKSCDSSCPLSWCLYWPRLAEPDGCSQPDT